MSLDRPLALTMGEPAGIASELTLKAWLNRPGLPVFTAVDDPSHLAALAETLRLPVPIRLINDLDEAAAVFPDALPVLPCSLAEPSRPGQPTGANARAVIASIEQAVALTKSGKAAGVVTNPIAKSVLQSVGFPYPGHTEFLGALAGGAQPVMMLASPLLRVVPVTIHVALRQVPDLLTADLIVETARIVAADFRRHFGLPTPRIAVAGLNPHAGENGRMGREDIEVVGPAISQLQAEGIAAFGPLSADTMFHAEARKRYDVALCMYHDQALIPLKTLDFAGGVNVTLGLPFVRTSPDHGTAFDIAGQGIADPASLIAAIRLAGEMTA
ncbi:4-hydroxythreonine-4-phosphate dehydrogenase PdxA [Lacibacterium aquatile]|uniref:4-hydroxythreonine-4-phosphate dehydrogenase n=1 Tax=Lacibacterium aquatile TaxID=1168082 RepID=A0ABW5DN40_9PROT